MDVDGTYHKAASERKTQYLAGSKAFGRCEVSALRMICIALSLYKRKVAFNIGGKLGICVSDRDMIEHA